MNTAEDSSFLEQKAKLVIDAHFQQITICEDEIEEQHFEQFCQSISDHSHPVMRNENLYFWRLDYEKFISELETIESDFECWLST